MNKNIGHKRTGTFDGKPLRTGSLWPALQYFFFSFIQATMYCVICFCMQAFFLCNVLFYHLCIQTTIYKHEYTFNQAYIWVLMKCFTALFIFVCRHFQYQCFFFISCVYPSYNILLYSFLYAGIWSIQCFLFIMCVSTLRFIFVCKHF